MLWPKVYRSVRENWKTGEDNRKFDYLTNVKLQASHVSFNRFNLLEIKEEVWKSTAIYSSIDLDVWEYLYHLILKNKLPEKAKYFPFLPIFVATLEISSINLKVFFKNIEKIFWEMNLS